MLDYAFAKTKRSVEEITSLVFCAYTTRVGHLRRWNETTGSFYMEFVSDKV